MSRIKIFFNFWYHFIVGDDWRVAASVVVGLCLIALLAHGSHAQLWWILPVLVVATLTLSLWLSVRRR
jgi:hypothetical protein